MEHVKTFPTGFGERLREERERLGFSQTDLARMTGIHRNTLARYEKESTQPTPIYLSAIRSLGVNIDYVLVGLRDEMPIASERLLLEICDLMGIPFEEVQTAVAAALKAENLAQSHHEAAGEIRRQAAQLLKLSPELNSKRKQLSLDRDMLLDIIEGIERNLLGLERRVPPLRKAHVIASLYRIFSEKGEIDPEALKSAVRSIAKP